MPRNRLAFRQSAHKGGPPPPTEAGLGVTKRSLATALQSGCAAGPSSGKPPPAAIEFRQSLRRLASSCPVIVLRFVSRHTKAPPPPPPAEAGLGVTKRSLATALQVNDHDLLTSRLSEVNYYRLSAYWHPFRQPCSDHLQPGTCFETVWDRYVFDRQLRVLTMDAIERVEISIRTRLVNRFILQHGAFGHIDRNNLPNLSGSDHRTFLAKSGARNTLVRKISSGTFMPNTHRKPTSKNITSYILTNSWRCVINFGNGLGSTGNPAA